MCYPIKYLLGLG